MASANAVASKGKADDVDAMFEGGTRIGAPDINGWFDAKEVGAECVGKIVYAMEFKGVREDDRPRKAVLIELLRDCKFAVMDQQPITLKKGQVLAVGVSAALKDLLYYVEHHGVVKVTYTGEKKLERGRKVKKFEVIGAKGAKRSMKPFFVSRIEEASTDGSDGDLPFE